MARIRAIKPDFFISLTNSRLTLEQRLTFIGLWTHCDDAGRCVDDARLVRGAIWALPIPKAYGGTEYDRTTRDVEADLAVLDKEDKIIRYRHDDMPLIQVTNWRRHQVINRPSTSRLAAPEGYDARGNRIEPPH